MSVHSTSEVVGSLLRPASLVRARAARESGTISAAEFKRVEDRAVDQVIALQESTGLDVLTDGELRRGIFTGPLTENLTGLEHVPGVTRTWYTPDGPIEEELPVVVTGKIAARRATTIEDFTYTRARARTAMKVTLPSPLMMFQRWSPKHSTEAYTDPFEMAADAAAIVRAEVRELAALGCEYVQIDAPEIAALVQSETREWFERQGLSVQRILTEGLDLLNSVTDVPGVYFGVHLCRGNRNGRWMAAAATTTSQSRSFAAAPDSTGSCWSTTTNALARSNRWRPCLGTAPWSWAWCRPRTPESNRATRSSPDCAPPPNSRHRNSSPCPRNAASPRRSTPTRT